MVDGNVSTATVVVKAREGGREGVGGGDSNPTVEAANSTTILNKLKFINLKKTS